MYNIFDVKWEDVGRSCFQAWAALAVSRFLEVETEGCELHNGDKIAAWAFGVLERCKTKESVDPPTEGKALTACVSKCASYFSYGE